MNLLLPANCRFVVPTRTSWSLALAAHLGLHLFAGVPLGAIIRSVPHGSSARRTTGICVALVVVTAVPVGVSILRARRPDLGTWMVAFLASTFGFSTFFKALAVAFGTEPEGADSDLATFLVWFNSLPEPTFVKGKMLRARRGELARCCKMHIVKLLALSGLLSALLSFDDYRPFGGSIGKSDEAGAGSGGRVPYLLDSALHLWSIYLWASSCLDFASLPTIAFGKSVDRAFLNPLLSSRSFRECWGDRWNKPVHVFLKRTIYKPARAILKLSPMMSAVSTFVVSGLLHEYNFSIHNARGYRPGHALAFFLLMGCIMIAEDALWAYVSGRQRLSFQTDRRRWKLNTTRIPTVVVSVVLQLSGMPAFGPLFMKSWLDSGMLESVGGLVPRVQCDL